MKLHFKIKFSLLVLFVGFTFSLVANAATLDLSLEKEIVSTKEDIAVLVTINSEGQDINTAQASISFPVNLLQVVSIDRTNSVFSFWLEEPVFDNNKGSIRFVGGSISGFNGPNLKVMRVSFKVKGSGSGRIGVADGAITASDGTGSNVYNTARGLDINIPVTSEFQAVKLEKSKKEAILSKELPLKIGLNIPFYPDPTKWNNRSASFHANWNINSDTTRAGISINKEPLYVPAPSDEAMIGNKIFSALSDGVWYLHVRVENNIGWSPTLHYRIAVDTTPPSSFKINNSDEFKTINPRPTISFLSSDLTSGINSYVIRLDGTVLTSTDLTSYTFDPLLPGTHSLIVTAVDKAGNSTSQSETLEIIPIESPEITYVSRSSYVNEGGITAGGTSIGGVEVIIRLMNKQEQIIFEQIVPVDSNGNWNITISKPLNSGEYYLFAISRNKDMASSIPVVSDSITIKSRPILTIGNWGINQTTFFILVIIILIGVFSAGWFSYHTWKGKLGRRVIIAERDVVNIFNNLNNDIDKLSKDYSNDNLKRGDLSEIKSILKNMKDNLDKSHRYIIENIKEINH